MRNELKVWRAKRRLTQLDLANKVGMANSRLSYIETEKVEPTDDEIPALADALDCTPADIFPGLATEQPASQETR